MDETIWIITHHMPSDCPKARKAAEMDEYTKEFFFKDLFCMHCGKELKASKKAKEERTGGAMTPEELTKYREAAEKAPTENLLAEVAHHVANAMRDVERLGSVRVSILLLEVLQARLAKEAASGN